MSAEMPMHVSGAVHQEEAEVVKDESAIISYVADVSGNIAMAIDAKNNLTFCEGTLLSVFMQSDDGKQVNLLELLTHARGLIASIETGDRDWRPHFEAIRKTLKGATDGGQTSTS